MSWQVTEAVLQHSTARSGARLVLLAIAARADAETGEAWPSVETIAAEAGLKPRQTQAMIRRLELAGELVTQVGRGRNHTSVYRVTCLEKVQSSAPFKSSHAGEKVQPPAQKVQDFAEKVQSPAPEPENHQEPERQTARETPQQASPYRGVQPTEGREARPTKAPTPPSSAAPPLSGETLFTELLGARFASGSAARIARWMGLHTPEFIRAAHASSFAIHRPGKRPEWTFFDLLDGKLEMPDELRALKRRPMAPAGPPQVMRRPQYDFQAQREREMREASRAS